jgi:hypothetical protein
VGSRHRLGTAATRTTGWEYDADPGFRPCGPGVAFNRETQCPPGLVRGRAESTRAFGAGAVPAQQQAANSRHRPTAHPGRYGVEPVIDRLPEA